MHASPVRRVSARHTHAHTRPRACPRVCPSACPCARTQVEVSCDVDMSVNISRCSWNSSASTTLTEHRPEPCDVCADTETHVCAVAFGLSPTALACRDCGHNYIGHNFIPEPCGTCLPRLRRVCPYPREVDNRHELVRLAVDVLCMHMCVDMCIHMCYRHVYTHVYRRG